MLVTILGYVGVLHDPAHPAPLGGAMTSQQRERARAPNGGDARYPVDQWRGSHGVDEASAARLFGAWL